MENFMIFFVNYDVNKDFGVFFGLFAGHEETEGAFVLGFVAIFTLNRENNQQ